jgi:hypothetical protein
MMHLHFYDDLDCTILPVDEGLKGLVDLFKREGMSNQRTRLNPPIAHERGDLAEGPISFGAASRQRNIPLGKLESIDGHGFTVDSNQSNAAILSDKFNRIG